MHKRFISSITVAFCVTILLSVSGLGQKSTKPIAEIRNDGGSVSWRLLVPHKSVTLTVSTPEGTVFRREFRSGTTPEFTPINSKGEFYPDGSFTYELVITPIISADTKEQMRAARANGTGDVLTSDLVKRGVLPAETSESGSFALANGQLITANDIMVEPESFGSSPDSGEPDAKTGLTNKVGDGTASLTPGDQQILDDLIVVGSACIGQDCVNGESFGFDTLRLKENNLRIRAFDTSTSASFPTNDWQITFNETSNGGRNKFSIDDIDGGRTPFTIEASAPSHSLYVEDGGRIGLGTSTPVVQLHVKDGNTPTLRLEQDGSSGFAAQTWDVAGNEANFFIRDASSGSTLPFRIFPGAPSNALTIEGSTGDIGIGTTAPDSDLDIEAPRPALRLTGTDSGQQWEQKMNGVGNLNFQSVVTGNNVLQLSPTGNASLLQLGLTANNRVDITGSLFINNVDNSSPDYVFEPDFALLSIEDHAKYMWSNKHLPAVGKSLDGEDGKGVINVGARSQGVLEELETAHIYIEQLHQRLEAMNRVVADIQKRLSDLEKAQD